MPTQRSYFGSFLAAFRAHSSTLPKPTSTIPTSSAAIAAAASIWTSAATTTTTTTTSSTDHLTTTTQSTSTTSPRPINPKPTTTATTVTQHPPLQHNVSPATHLPRSPQLSGVTTSQSPTSTATVFGPQNKPAPNYPSVQDVRRSRRGSDSSTSDYGGGYGSGSGAGGYGAGGIGEKWFIGGRTATGEERFYKLSMVRRERSADRISADQLSL